MFAYTIKAWNLPTAGHPANHSALLLPEQWRELDVATVVGAAWDLLDEWVMR